MADLEPDIPGVTLRPTAETGYHSLLRQKIESRGGFYNAHLHIDRSGSLSFVEQMLRREAEATPSAISLQRKHALVTLVHESELYSESALSRRIGDLLEAMAAIGTSIADSTVDVTDDGLGLKALEVFRGLKEGLRGRLDFRVGAYNPLGFRSDQPRRWDLFFEAAQSADFIASLPERDDTVRYPDHIGYVESVRRVLELGADLGKEVHIHVDQENHQFENASESVAEILDSLSLDLAKGSVWLIHAISPSAYGDARFSELASRLARLGVGVIVCPSAAISMRQLRGLAGPMRNSIARVLDFAVAGVPIRVGSDNIFDITSPAGTPDLMTEMFVLAHALRFFDTDVLAAFATGQELNGAERETVAAHLERDRVEEARAIEFLRASGRMD